MVRMVPWRGFLGCGAGGHGSGSEHSRERLRYLFCRLLALSIPVAAAPAPFINVSAAHYRLLVWENGHSSIATTTNMSRLEIWTSEPNAADCHLTDIPRCAVVVN